MKQDSYKGTYEQVREQLYAAYINGDTELCSYFDASAPDLTIAETVKLFAELRDKIDGDTVIRFCEGTAINVESDDAVSFSEVLELLQQATVNCLITYPEADCTPDLLTFSTPNGMSLQTAIEAFRKTVSTHASEHSEDRLARLDSIIHDMEHLYGCDCCGFHIHCCAEIVE